MQKCDLQVNKLIRLEYGKYRLNKVIYLIIVAGAQVDKRIANIWGAGKEAKNREG